MGGKHLIPHLEIAEPEAPRIVTFKQGDFSIEGGDTAVEHVLDAHLHELLRFLRD